MQLLRKGAVISGGDERSGFVDLDSMNTNATGLLYLRINFMVGSVLLFVPLRWRFCDVPEIKALKHQNLLLYTWVCMCLKRKTKKAICTDKILHPSYCNINNCKSQIQILRSVLMLLML